MKLLLTSFWTSPAQDRELLALVGKPADAIHVAYIENAYDVYDDEASLIEGREIIRDKGFDVEVVDLREWRNYPDGLRKKLESKDVFWLARLAGC
ncbi:MAG: hypothetical protein IPK19_22775 [Chloroflexi bacterium]|nr:hypothetical protein [Chloroflexota bacterium]